MPTSPYEESMVSRRLAQENTETRNKILSSIRSFTTWLKDVLGIVKNINDLWEKFRN